MQTFYLLIDCVVNGKKSHRQKQVNVEEWLCKYILHMSGHKRKGSK